jgi:hypothetical protein
MAAEVKKASPVDAFFIAARRIFAQHDLHG